MDKKFLTLIMQLAPTCPWKCFTSSVGKINNIAKAKEIIIGKNKHRKLLTMPIRMLDLDPKE